jgi:hypothetical protein
MLHIKSLFKSSRARVTLALVVIGIAVIVSFFLPKETDPNIGLTSDNVTPTVGITHPVSTLSVNRGTNFRNIHLTVTHVEEAGAFSDDLKPDGTYTVRVHVYMQPGVSIQSPQGINYASLIRLVLPDGEQIPPKLIAVPPVVFPGQANNGYFDFPVAARTPLATLTLSLGEGSAVVFSTA